MQTVDPWGGFMQGQQAIGNSLADLAKSQNQRQQNEMAMQQNQRANSLADLQAQQLRMSLAESALKQSQDEELRSALTNPKTATTFAPSSQGATVGLQADPSLTEVTGRQTESPTQTIARVRMQQGRVEEAAKAISMDDAIAQYGAKLQASGGDLKQYYAAKNELDQGKEFFGFVKDYIKKPEMLKALWPVLVKAYPKAAGITPDMLRGTPEGIASPVTTPDGKVVPGKFYLYDNEGKIHIIDDKTEAVETWGEPYEVAVGGKKAMVQKSNRGQIKPVVQDVSTTVKVSNSGEDGPVAQSTFVDPETGKPLVFDKKTGSYRIANVEGGVTPKPAALTPEAAAKTQLVEQGLTYIPRIREGLFDSKGNVDRIKVANIGARTPFTKGRELSTLILDAVEAKLRAESGAAVPEPEVKRAAKRFIPHVADQDSTIKIKIDNLEAFLKGTSDKINRGRQGGTSSGPKPGQVEKGYRFKGGNPADKNSWVKI